MRVAQRGERLQLVRDGVGSDIERGARSDRCRADPLLGPPPGHLSREEVLARLLVAAAADDPDLVAVVDDGSAPQQVHQGVTELDAPKQLGAALAARTVRDHPCRPAHVVVAEEGRRRVRDAVRPLEVVVVVEPRDDPLGARITRGVARGGVLEREVEHVRELVIAHEGRKLDRVRVEHLAEELEIGHAGGARCSEDLGRPDLEERPVDVARRVDPEAVDLRAADPVAVHLRQPVHHRRLLGEEVVEAEEVTLLETRLAAGAEVDVAAVVVAAHVVQPRRLLRIPVLCEHDRHAREVAGLQAGERLAARVPSGIERLAAAVAERCGGVAGARGDDDVRGVVDDDVEIDLQPEAVRAGYEVREVLVRAEMRVDGCEVPDPVAVVGGARALHRLLAEGRRHPDRGEAERLDPREARARRAAAGEAAEVAAVEPARVGRVVAGDAARPRTPAAIVGGIAVRVAVGHDEIDPLRGDRAAAGRLCERFERRARRRCGSRDFVALSH